MWNGKYEANFINILSLSICDTAAVELTQVFLTHILNVLQPAHIRFINLCHFQPFWPHNLVSHAQACAHTHTHRVCCSKVKCFSLAISVHDSQILYLSSADQKSLMASSQGCCVRLFFFVTKWMLLYFYEALFSPKVLLLDQKLSSSSSTQTGWFRFIKLLLNHCYDWLAVPWRPSKYSCDFLEVATLH